MQSVPETHYGLVTREGHNPRLSSGAHEGVSLAADRIAWCCGGKSDGAPFANIREVQLFASGDARHPNTCTLTFADGHKLMVISGGADGYADPQRAETYAAFVRDLHARLQASASVKARFIAGYRSHNYPLAIAASLALGIICIVVPVHAFIRTGEFGLISLLSAGLWLYLPIMKTIETNAPRSYDPRHPPAELIG